MGFCEWRCGVEEGWELEFGDLLRDETWSPEGLVLGRELVDWYRLLFASASMLGGRKVTNATTGRNMNEAVCLVCNVSLFHFQLLILILPVDKLELLLAFVVDTLQVLWHSHVSAT
jgi:hypothetical protein